MPKCILFFANFIYISHYTFGKVTYLDKFWRCSASPEAYIEA